MIGCPAAAGGERGEWGLMPNAVAPATEPLVGLACCIARLGGHSFATVAAAAGDSATGRKSWWKNVGGGGCGRQGGLESVGLAKTACQSWGTFRGCWLLNRIAALFLHLSPPGTFRIFFLFFPSFSTPSSRSL